MEQAKKPNAAVVALIVIVLVGAVAGGAFYVMSNKDTATQSQEETPTPAPDTSSEAESSSESFKDGTYVATGSYLSPGGEESVDVEVTLKDDAITDATVSPHPASSTSTQYQGEFVANFKPLVIGKDISEVHLSRVAGSSLTSGGFNEALDQIKSEAKA